MPDISRQKRTYDYWIKELYKLSLDDASFITKHNSSQEIPSCHYLYPTEDNKIHNRKKFKDTIRSMKRIIGARYFLNRYDYDWYWSLTDDTLIDLNSLNSMMKELYTKHNPEKDIVMKGHLYKHDKSFYTQGGTGFLISKAAAKNFVSFGAKWASKLSWPEDRYISIIIKKLHTNEEDVKSPYMFGMQIQCNLLLKK